MQETKWTLMMALAAAAGTTATGQILSDNVGTAALWTILGDGDSSTSEDVRYGFNYGNYDIFGDGFLTGSIPEAPNNTGGPATTGIFLSANNDSQSAVSLFTGLIANNVNVGVGTATPNFVLKFDAYNQTATGLDGTPPGSATNYQWAGINYNIADIPASAGGVGPYGGPFSTFGANGGASTSGQTLAITGDGDSGDDWEVTIGATVIEADAEGPNGLATGAINQAFTDAGLAGAGISPLNTATENNNFTSPIPGNEAAYDVSDPATYQQFWVDQFAPPPGQPSFTTNPASNINPNDTLLGGTPFNSWASHEIYFVDGVWTHVINGVPVLQIDPDDAGDMTQLVTESGTIALGFLDGFSSFNNEPEGSNFALYDNIILEAATAGDVPSQAAFLLANGYVPGATGEIDGDYNDSGLVEQGDLDQVLANWGAGFASIPASWINQRPTEGIVDQAELDVVLQQWGSSAAPDFAGSNVPEPATLALLGLGGLAMLRRRA